MKPKSRTLFSVIEVTGDGDRHCEVDWHRDISSVLDEISPNYEFTDKIIDMAEDLLTAEDSLKADADPS